MSIKIDRRWASGYRGPLPERSEWRHDNNPDIKPGALYYLHATDEPVYVGCTINPRQRLRVHTRKPWWSEIIRAEIIWYPDQVDARRIEALQHQRRRLRYCLEAPPVRYRDGYQPVDNRWAMDWCA